MIPDAFDSSPLESVVDQLKEPKPWVRAFYDGVIIALAVWLGLLTATAEAFLTPFRMFGVLIPVSVLAAIVITPALSIVPFRMTGRRAWCLLPVAAWASAALFWAQGSSEGDVVLAGDSWVAMLYLLAGSGAAAFGAYRVLLMNLRQSPPLLDASGRVGSSA